MLHSQRSGRFLLVAALGFSGLVGACGGDEYLNYGNPDGGTGGGAGTSGLPCDVAQVLSAHCLSCHGNPPSGAPNSLARFSDLTAASPVVAGQTVAQRALARMMDGTMPPKPAAAVPAADITAFKTWLDGGAAQGTCASDPLTAAATCTSGTTWTRGNRGSTAMNPGRACISCHTGDPEAPIMDIAGTVFPTGHEPDLCNGTVPNGGSATVQITDAKGVVLRLPVNAAGNFMHETLTPFTPPYTAVVISGTKRRAMNTPQTNGDCNSCHTQNGTSGAPGRITLPF